uniref:Uncharacterized protein n=1 Tax=Anguilla anguilla TaxID=7936 RepID=A0A0E9RF93_ANGAN
MSNSSFWSTAAPSTRRPRCWSPFCRAARRHGRGQPGPPTSSLRPRSPCCLAPGGCRTAPGLTRATTWFAF